VGQVQAAGASGTINGIGREEADRPPQDHSTVAELAIERADIVRAAPKPVIVTGDLNIKRGEPAWGVQGAASTRSPRCARS
jgi:endonuclease/exonuclease/phosphatase family metal-dependent hydrolase